MSVNMTITGIRDNVDAILKAMVDDYSETGETLFGTVLSHEPTDEANFQSYPAASHYYVGAEANYATVSQNRRVIEYVIEAYILTDQLDSMADEYDKAYKVADMIMSKLDRTIDLSSSELSLSPACDLMRPTPSSLERVRLSQGQGFVATIRLFCEADITFRDQ